MAKKRASITDLAQQLNISISTVSRALSGHSAISEATVKRVTALAKELGYQPNSLASGLRKGRSNMLGVVVPHIDGNFFSQVVKGIEAAASKAGYHVLICQSNEDVVHERANVETLMNAQVEGILVSLSRTTREMRHFEKVRKRDIPLVFFDRILDGFDVNAVVLDDRAGGYRATKHLLEQGYRRIAHFTGPQHLNIYKLRRQGYEDALREYGLPVAEDLILLGDMKMDDGSAGMRQLLTLPQPPDAVFSGSDFSAAGALQVLTERGLRAPEDIGLVGFSNELFSRLTAPQLTSIDQHCELMGRSATSLLFQIMQEREQHYAPRHVVLQPDLFVRASSLRLGQPA
ncbi:substrate-binding domain-containing protein [Hymenobacter sp. HMF4947]|uniref:Substrate-binding domain-containing protein n=1 Tax=Hymenobacter ginkgonis TaxID=2682976 RepID=A0A7K1TGT1_9BACT|nr:LacI family DNA-binding transcriptional regulator [Hymenobacter ginkgonis]MVN77522.1 substrate-binding domain-containing protein [Hymenobacter ginkgonis]